MSEPNGLRSETSRPIDREKSPHPANTQDAPLPFAAARQRMTSKNDPNSIKPPFTHLRERRRSSVLSFSSLDEITQSFHDEVLQPSISTRKRSNDENEVTHWHSSPLAFALLPAIAGLLFKNGSTFLTDILLLGLAAIFMNWSIRLPWDWYYSAQSLRREVEPLAEERVEEEPDEAALETASSVTSSPRLGPTANKSDISGGPVSPEEMQRREYAAKELRRQELLALMATFLFPMGAAYLLHVIRGQLSRPSTGLVSDYNLSIFLLAAEVRPFRQLVRLMSDRTLHLQRTVTGLDHPFASNAEDESAVAHLRAKLAELETSISDQSLNSANAASAQTSGVNDLAAEIRKRYEPRLEGLERAVRRYEKRSATLAMLTEQRLQALEARVNDAVSLAAAAAQNSRGRGFTGRISNQIAFLAVAPIRLAWDLVTWPFVVLDDVSGRVKNLMLGPMSKQKGKSRGVARDETSRVKSGTPRKLAR